MSADAGESPAESGNEEQGEGAEEEVPEEEGEEDDEQGGEEEMEEEEGNEEAESDTYEMEIGVGIPDHVRKELVEVSRALKRDLDKIAVMSVDIKDPVFDPERFPPSYKDNNPKEQIAIIRCNAFIKQWIHLFHDRQPIFLKPKNEFGVEKLVCTTINPTQLPYKDLLDWPDIAHFVADYLNYNRLNPPEQLPKNLFAPQTVLERQRGHCFEYSTLLCSMLIGSGYDAYVVSGYATKEVCNTDLSYTRCPLVEDDEIVYPKPITLNICRYTVRPPRRFASEYLLRMEMKNEGIKKERQREKFQLQEAERKIREAPPKDPIRGWRIHSWVMVLAGMRGVKETFFIEPTTGVPHPTNWEEYLGIETLWNHYNYYLNVQQETVSVSQPVTKYVERRPLNKWPLKFDIGDSRDWEYVFSGQDLHVVKTSEESIEERAYIAKHGDQILEEKHFDLPMSWTSPLKITRDDYDMRFPGGKKSVFYKCATMDEYAHYLMPDGLIQKLRVFSDLHLYNLYYTKEFFAHRADLMESRFFDCPKGKMIEYFAYGRDDFLREHHYQVATPFDPETKRVMLFEKEKRLDELYKREQGEDYVKQYYGARADRKHYKEIRFGPQGKVREKLAPPNARPIEVVIESFSRDPSKLAHKDIDTITYSVYKDEIHIKYHVADHMIVCSTRSFVKPDNWWDPTVILAWSPDLHECFDADVFTPPLSELALYQMLLSLMDAEENTRHQTRVMEKENLTLVKTREKELSNPVLVRQYFQADRDSELRLLRLKEKARDKAARLLKRMDYMIVRDYLQPYLDRLGLASITNKKQANRVKDDIMQDLRERLTLEASIMKDGFEEMRELIGKTQRWYQQHYNTLSKDEAEDCKQYLIQHMFVAHILELRFIQFKEYAPIKYAALYDRLKNDHRLQPFIGNIDH